MRKKSFEVGEIHAKINVEKLKRLDDWRWKNRMTRTEAIEAAIDALTLKEKPKK